MDLTAAQSLKCPLAATPCPWIKINYSKGQYAEMGNDLLAGTGPCGRFISVSGSSFQTALTHPYAEHSACGTDGLDDTMLSFWLDYTDFYNLQS